MEGGEKSIPAVESPLRRVQKERHSESSEGGGSRHSAQGRSQSFLGSIQLAEFMRLMPFQEDGAERRQVGINATSYGTFDGEAHPKVQFDQADSGAAGIFLHCQN
jgi:hypothetical protein